MAVEKVTEELAEEVTEQPDGLPLDVEIEGEEYVLAAESEILGIIN